MKNQKWGLRTACDNLRDLQLYNFRTDTIIEDILAARVDYREKRENGKKGGDIPGDGKCTWIKERCGRGDGGVEENDGYYHYDIRYDEGPRDKEWMEEGDWEYIQKLYREGTLLEKEPIADIEIVEDHKYRDEITRTLMKAYVEFRGAFIIAARRAINQFNHAVQKLLWPDRVKTEAKEALKNAFTRAAEENDEELFNCCRSVWEQLIARYSESERNDNTKLLLTILKDLLDKHERREILLASERLALREAEEVKSRARAALEEKARTAKEAQAKVQSFVSKTAVIIETLKKQIITAGKDLVEIQPFASFVGTMRTAEILEVIKNAITAETEIRKQLDVVLDAHEKTKAQADIALDATCRTEELLRANPFDDEIKKFADIAIQSVKEAEKLHAIVLAASKEADKQYLIIIEAKKKIALVQAEKANESAQEAQEYATKATQLLNAIREQKDQAGAVVDKIKRFSSTNKELVNAANAVMAGIEKQLELAVSSTAELTKQVAVATDAAKKTETQIKNDPTAIAETTKQVDTASQAALEAKKQLDLSIITINAALENVKKGVGSALEVEGRTKKEAKNQEDKVRQIVTTTNNVAENIVNLMKTLQEQIEVVINMVTEIETLAEIYTAAAVNTKKQADIDLSVKLKQQTKAATPVIDEVKKQVAEALPLEEEIKKQIRLANDILQKAEEIRKANPLAVDEIAAQVDIAAKTLAEMQRLKETANKALEKGKTKVALAQNAKEHAQAEVQSSAKVPMREIEESGKKELEDLRKQAEQLKLERERFETDKEREAEKKKLQEEIERQKRALAEGKAVDKRAEKPAEFTASLQFISHKALTYGKVLGQGGFGKVYQGEWQNATVAIKELLAPRLSEVAMEEFKKETNVWGRLHHPNIVQLYGISTDEPQHYSMVMELMPNGSLYQVLRNGQPLGWEIRFHIARDIAAGLTHLHEQEILHCDLKSMNVLLDGTMRAKLTDFGLSKVKVETKTTTAGTSKASGTIRWMAPELLKRGGKPSKESDVYAFAMILWEIATRKIPYEDATDDTVAMGWIKDGEKETVPEDCQKTYPSYAALIARCWEERSRRPTIQNAAEELKPLEAEKEADPSLASGPVQLDNFASVAPR